MDKIAEYFLTQYSYPALQVMSISTGIIGSDNIDCYNVFDVAIQLKNIWRGSNFKDLKMPPKLTAKSLLVMNSKVKININEIAIDLN